MLQFDGDEGLILDQDAEGVITPELSESNATGTEEDITVLEENAVLSPMPDVSAAPAESGSESFSSIKMCITSTAACAEQDRRCRFTFVSFLLFRVCGGASVAGGHCADSCC